MEENRREMPVAVFDSGVGGISVLRELVRQMPGGTYRVNDDLVRDSRIGVSGQHASNIGALIGHELEEESGVPAYIVDPPDRKSVV